MDTCQEGGSLTSQTYGGVISVPCGYGKCLGKDTPVMMYDGSIKMVHVVVDDLLMGDDSKPRRVLSLNRGREMMYKVVPVKGEPWLMNHIYYHLNVLLSKKILKGLKK